MGDAPHATRSAACPALAPRARHDGGDRQVGMTHDERQTVLLSSWHALLALIPPRRLVQAGLHIDALRLLYVEDGADQFAAGLRKGVLIVESREDRRDLDDVQAPTELGSVH
jgi:hypothetical protein